MSQTQQPQAPQSEELAILPVREIVLFPGGVQPITVGRESSLALLNSLHGEEKRASTKERLAVSAILRGHSSRPAQLRHPVLYRSGADGRLHNGEFPGTAHLQQRNARPRYERLQCRVPRRYAHGKPVDRAARPYVFSPSRAGRQRSGVDVRWTLLPAGSAPGFGFVTDSL